MTSPLRDEKGMVLLLVLVIVALLTALLTEFAFSTLVDLRLTETFRDNTRAYYYAKSGITAGRMLLKIDELDKQQTYDAHDEMWAQPFPNIPVGDGVVSLAIEDQGGKLDINNLWNPSGKNPVSTLVSRAYNLFVLLKLPEPENRVAAIIDWLDEDDVETTKIILGPGVEIPAQGGESSFYQRLDVPYPCENGRLDSLEALGMIRGFTPEILKIVAPYLTVHGNIADLINVNTARQEMLAAVFVFGSVELSDAENAAETVLKVRETGPIKDLTKLDLGVVSKTGLTLESDTFRIESEGGVGDGVRRIEAFVEKSGDKLLYIKVN
jgi:general secretion pathway protein K